MFTLTSAELDHAFAAIQHHGYSAMLPDPPEWQVVVDNWDTVRAAIERVDLDTYEPFSPLTLFAPKNRSNVRVLHLLHPQDLIIYTALTLIAKNDIEANRISVKAKRVFSYRADPKTSTVLYSARGSYEAYRAQLQSKANIGSVKYVAVADIADFYPRIYQHRLENVIESIAKGQRVRDVARVLVRKLIANLMKRNSYGIPVGPYASRLLAEAVMIDVDAALHTEGVNFVRWVDDFNIFCKSEYEAQSVLFRLGECLFVNHGLTLQSAKTKILPVERYKTDVLSRHEARVRDRDAVVQALRDFRLGYDDRDEEDDEELVEQALAALQGSDLKGMLEESLADTALVDYEAVTFSLSKLPRLPGVDPHLKRQVLDLVIDNAALLYPVAEHVARYVLSFDDLTSQERKRISKKLVKALRTKRHAPPEYFVMWMLQIFASSPEWNHASDIVGIYAESTSDLVKRYAALAIHASGTRPQALAVKDDYGAASPLRKLAILFASRKLGQDERKHWKLANAVNGALEKLI